MMTLSRSYSVVARGKCGIDLMFLPLESTTKTVESPGAQLQSSMYSVPMQLQN
jgi:hypothetical protein